MKTSLYLLLCLGISGNIFATSELNSYITTVDSLQNTGVLDSRNFPSDCNEPCSIKGYYMNGQLVMILTKSVEKTGSLESRFYVKDLTLVAVCEIIYPPLQARMDSESHFDSKGNIDYSYARKRKMYTRIVYGDDPTVYIEHYGEKIRTSKKQREDLSDEFRTSFGRVVNEVAMTIK